MGRFDLAFEGGGAKGVAFVGALEELFGNGHEPGRAVGTSAGAISAALLAAGYSPAEMLEAATERLTDGSPRFTSFLDVPESAEFTLEQCAAACCRPAGAARPLAGAARRALRRWAFHAMLRFQAFRQLVSLIEHGGLFSGTAFLDWIEEKLAAKGFPPRTTFREFARLSPVELTVIASDVTEREMLTLNHRATPDLPVAWAVRMSMSIPFVWQEVIWREEWGRYRGRSKAGAAVVDGGAISNFPMKLLVEPGGDDLVMGPPRSGSAALGLLIDEDAALEAATAAAAEAGPLARLRTAERLSRLIRTMMQADDNEVIRRFGDRVCRIPAKGYGTLEFDLEGERLERFIDAGRRSMRRTLRDLGLSRRWYTGPSTQDHEQPPDAARLADTLQPNFG